MFKCIMSCFITFLAFDFSLIIGEVVTNVYERKCRNKRK